MHEQKLAFKITKLTKCVPGMSATYPTTKKKEFEGVSCVPRLSDKDTAISRSVGASKSVTYA